VMLLGQIFLDIPLLMLVAPLDRTVGTKPLPHGLAKGLGPVEDEQISLVPDVFRMTLSSVKASMLCTIRKNT